MADVLEIAMTWTNLETSEMVWQVILICAALSAFSVVPLFDALSPAVAGQSLLGMMAMCMALIKAYLIVDCKSNPVACHKHFHDFIWTVTATVSNTTITAINGTASSNMTATTGKIIFLHSSSSSVVTLSYALVDCNLGVCTHICSKDDFYEGPSAVSPNSVSEFLT